MQKMNHNRQLNPVAFNESKLRNRTPKCCNVSLAHIKSDIPECIVLMD